MFLLKSFPGLTAGAAYKRKMAEWQLVTVAVNTYTSEQQTVTEMKTNGPIEKLLTEEVLAI